VFAVACFKASTDFDFIVMKQASTRAQQISIFLLKSNG